MTEEARRRTILELLRCGTSPAEIKRQIGASLSTIRRVRVRQTAERCPRTAPRPVRSPELVAQVAQSVKQNPRQTIRGLARNFGVSKTAMGQVVKEDLAMASYARTRRHKISPGAKVRRLQRCKKLLNHLKNRDKGKTLIFSDEKFFTLAPYSNRRNDKVIWRKGEQEACPDELRHVGMRQREAGAMFLGIVASNGLVGPSIWVPSGVKVNAAAYQDILSQQVKPWIDANFAPGTWVFQQDGAAAHTANKTQKYLDNNGWCFWRKDEWPPSSPDCAVLDYAIWDAIASVACRDTAPNVATMKERVDEAWCNMSANFVKKSCRAFRPRLEAVVASKGGRIE